MIPVPRFSAVLVRPQDALETVPFHYWTTPDRRGTWCEFRKLPGGQGFHLRFPELADFEVHDCGSVVLAFPAPGIDGDTIEHLYLNQVLPVALNAGGQPVFHGSAVDFGSGGTAFLGASGRGKSTLAAYLSLHGAKLLTDDSLILDKQQDGGCLVHPSHPSVRLWQDSLAALGGERLPAGTSVAYNRKARIPAGGSIAQADSPSPLRRAYFLGDATVDQVRILPISGTALAMRWVEHAFMLDIKSGSILGANLEHATWLAGLGISHVLDFPRDYSRLQDVRRALLDADTR